MTTQTRRLGRSDITVSAIGLGCNAIGGPHWDRSVRAELPVGYGQVDDGESVRALRRALDLGINFFDTADEYGCGHSERVLARGLGSQKNNVVISTKFGYVFNEETREVTGKDASPGYIRRACEASLRRLDRDWIDVYMLHLRDLPLAEAGQARDTLEALVAEGKIRWYGWSTDDVSRARFFAEGRHCAVIEHRLNLFIDAPQMLDLCAEYDLGSVNRIPLLMGLLAGRYNHDLRPRADDVRSLYFNSSQFVEDVDRLGRVKAILTGHARAGRERSLAQGALAWILARSPRAVPIPGFSTVWQVEDNAGVLGMPLLTAEEMAGIRAALR